MALFNPQFDQEALAKQLRTKDGLIVACYCALWCETCKTYQNDFAKLAEQWPQHTFLWIDIEELPELLGDADIEDFPTLLIQDHSENYFFSPLHPNISHLERLLRQADALSANESTGNPPLLKPLLSKP